MAGSPTCLVAAETELGYIGFYRFSFVDTLPPALYTLQRIVSDLGEYLKMDASDIPLPGWVMSGADLQQPAHMELHTRSKPLKPLPTYPQTKVQICQGL